MEINKIYNVDAYEAIKRIPDKSIDLIVTDPPYEIDTVGSKKNNISKTFANCNNQLKTICDGIDNSILDEFMRVMKKINIYIWCNKKQIPLYLDYFVTKNQCSFEIMVWCKTNPTPTTNNSWLPDIEYCLMFREKGTKLNHGYELKHKYYVSSANVYDKEMYKHPTIKPLEFVKQHILHSTQPNDIVLDCFCGSGATCVACKNTNRKYIGIELNPRWHKVAVDRLNNIQANGQQTLFTM